MVWFYAVSLTAGIFGWTIVAAVYPVILAVVFLLVRNGRREIALVAILSAACFSYGLLASVSFEREFEQVRNRSSAAGQIECAGRVAGFPEHRLGGTRFPFDTTVDGVPVRLLVSTVAFTVGYGDSVRLTGKLSSGRWDRRRYLMSRGARGYLRIKTGALTVLERGSALRSPRRLAWNTRESARCRLARRLGAVSGLALALSIGEKGSCRPRLRSVFSGLGVSHLLALSGMHLGLIAAFVLGISRLTAVRGRLPLLIVLTAYVCVVGEVVSLHRAYVMALVLILAAEAERPPQPLNALGTALFALLLARPGLAHSVAFQLSFTATLAVLLCVTRFRCSLGGGRVKRTLAAAGSTVLVSVCVQVFLLPLQLHYFGGVSLLTPLTTVVFLPAIAVVMLLSGAALVVDWIASPISQPLFTALGATVGLVERTLFVLASWAPGLAKLPAPNPVIYYAGQAAFWLPPAPWRRAWPRRLWRAFPLAARAVAAALICIGSFLPA